MLTVIFCVMVGSIIGYQLGLQKIKHMASERALSVLMDRVNFPVAVAEKIDGQYYLYEKDTTNFLCQAKTFEDLAPTLYENKHVNMAIVLCPEEFQDTEFWVINGKMKSIKR